jgi:hypothetical protein
MAAGLRKAWKPSLVETYVCTHEQVILILTGHTKGAKPTWSLAIVVDEMLHVFEHGTSARSLPEGLGHAGGSGLFDSLPGGSC